MNDLAHPDAYEGSEPYLFVSYRHAEHKLAYPIIRRLNEMGYRVWYDKALTSGTPHWNDDIAKRVEGCTLLLALCSKGYFQSENCRHELEYAHELGKTIHWINIGPLADKDIPPGIRMDFVKIHKIEKQKMSDDAFYHEIARGIGMDTCRSSSSHTSRSATKQAPQAKKPRHISRLDIPQAPKRTPVPSPSKERAPRVLTRCLAFLCPAIPAGLSIAALVLTVLHRNELLVIVLLAAELFAVSMLPDILSRYAAFDAKDKPNAIIWSVLAAVSSIVMIVFAVVDGSWRVFLFLLFIVVAYVVIIRELLEWQ